MKHPRSDLRLLIWGTALVLPLHLVILQLLHPFDGLYGQDAFAYIGYSRELWQEITAGNLPPPFFWPLGFPMMLIIPAQFVDIFPGAGLLPVWVAAYLLAAGTGFLAWYMFSAGHTKEEAGKIALLATVITAVTGQYMLWGQTVMSDVPALALAVWAAVFLFRFRRSRTRADLVIFALLLGLALATRWIYGILVLPVAIMFLRWRVPLSQWLLAVILFSIVSGLQIVIGHQQGSAGLYHPWLVDWHPGHMTASSFQNGLHAYEWPNLLFYARSFVSPRTLFPLLTPFFILALWYTLQDGFRSYTIFLHAWWLLVFLYLSGVPFQNFRFTLTILPPLFLLASGAMIRVYVGQKGLRLPLIIILLASLTGSIWYNYKVIGSFVGQKNEDKEVVELVRRTVSGGAPIFTFELTPMIEHYTDLCVVELFTTNPHNIREIVGRAENAYLLVRDRELAGRWRGRSPQINADYIRLNFATERLVERHSYTLYLVRNHES